MERSDILDMMTTLQLAGMRAAYDEIVSVGIKRQHGVEKLIGALRNGAPFKGWLLPGAIEKVRRKLAGTADGDRQMVKVLAAVLTDGLSAVDAACAESLSAGVASADVILNVLARQQQPQPAAPIMTPERLALRLPPIADCARYDDLRTAPAEACCGTF